jgi:UDP-N-acetylglucosamine 2-epimerase (non-hydrolysing)
MKIKFKVVVIFGTRPEAIKLAPVILKLREQSQLEFRVCVTAQHREMLDQVLTIFGIQPDIDLNLMRHRQSLADLTSRAINALDGYFNKEKPDLVLIQGDTTTVFCAALASFYNKISVGHVEAGLRTGNLFSPWPEEANRLLASRLTTLHFAPTETARQNLLREGIPGERIAVTGNTVIDALFMALEKVRKSPPIIPELPDFLQASSRQRQAGPRLVLITGHRRENFGKGFENICRAIADMTEKFPKVHFVYPVHMNPNVRTQVMKILGNHGHPQPRPGAKKASRLCSRASNLHLIEPLPYLEFVGLMERSTLILTDSGGIQEEAPSLGKPVLVMRETTERPEAVEAGTAHLVGTNRETILKAVSRLLTDESAYQEMSRAHNPYGDGKAAERIVRIIGDYLEGVPLT